MLDYLAQLRGGVDPRLRDSLVERLAADLDRPVHELSTGNRQKLGLAQAFMHEPELLILAAARRARAGRAGRFRCRRA